MLERDGDVLHMTARWKQLLHTAAAGGKPDLKQGGRQGLLFVEELVEVQRWSTVIRRDCRVLRHTTTTGHH